MYLLNQQRGKIIGFFTEKSRRAARESTGGSRRKFGISEKIRERVITTQEEKSGKRFRVREGVGDIYIQRERDLEFS